MVNIRVKKENSEFEKLNLTSYKKLYFHCLASVELKPHTKVLKNLVHNIAFKNLSVTPKLPTYLNNDCTLLNGWPQTDVAQDFSCIGLVK